ncbi:MAG: PKD domain-containing protein [Bacteroidota bacterium]
MKQLLLSGVLCWIGLYSLNAQITYTATDFAVVGDTFVTSRVTAGVNSIDFSQTGPNFNWVYDSLTINDQDVQRYLNPDDAGYFLTWLAGCVLGGGNPFSCPGIWNGLTDIAEQELDTFSLAGISLQNGVTHYRKTTNALEATIYGVTPTAAGLGLPITSNYDDIDTVYRFPLTYQQIDSSNAVLRANLGGGIVSIQQQQRINEVDGWGSLTTPFATYPQVLRMKTIIINDDSLTIVGGTTIPLPSAEVAYKWFAPGIGRPVMTASGNITLFGELITEIRYIDTLRCLAPNAFFLFFPPVAFLDSATLSADVSFFNQSGNADQFQWSFGDGTTSTQETPSHTYAAAGIFPVQLTACNSICNPLACDTFTLPVTVINPFIPNADFEVGSDTLCTTDAILFINTSTNATTYDWDFGDGGSSTEENPAYSYASPGTYTVTLITENNTFLDTVTQDIQVVAGPTPDLGVDFTLTTNQDTVLDAGTFDSYQWSTGETTATINLDGASLGVGVYDFFVDVTGVNGCQSRDSIQVTVTFPVSNDGAVQPFWNLYPNPVQDILTIQSGWRKQALVQIWNIQGQRLFVREIQPHEKLQVQAKAWAPGIYIIDFGGEKRKFIHE